MKVCRNTVKKFMDILFSVAAVLYGSATLLAFINAFCRKFLNIGISWGEELTTYMILVAFFLTIPYLELRDGSLCIGLLNNIIKNRKITKALYIIRGLLVMFLCVIVVRYALVGIQSAMSTNLLTFSLRWPKAIFYSIAMSGFALTVVSWITILLLNKGDKVE